MKKMLSTLAILTALAVPLAVSAQDQDESGPGRMMQEGEMGQMGGMHGMMQGDMDGMMNMMSQMGPMMEACTEMMAAMSEHMEDTDHHSGPSEQSEG